MRGGFGVLQLANGHLLIKSKLFTSSANYLPTVTPGFPSMVSPNPQNFHFPTVNNFPAGHRLNIITCCNVEPFVICCLGTQNVISLLAFKNSARISGGR
jgi:hypothetical protein